MQPAPRGPRRRGPRWRRRSRQAGEEVTPEGQDKPKTRTGCGDVLEIRASPPASAASFVLPNADPILLRTLHSSLILEEGRAVPSVRLSVAPQCHHSTQSQPSQVLFPRQDMPTAVQADPWPEVQT